MTHRRVDRISLGAELSELLAAIEGARILTDELAYDHFGSANDERAAPEAISAILSLVQIRGADLGRVLRQEKDPRALLAPHNATSTAMPEDVTFTTWTPAQCREQAQREIRRADAELHARRRTKK